MTEQDKIHYFDWAATSPADPDIMQDSVNMALANWGNPSSIHKAGTEAKAILTQARETCACVLGVKPEMLFFTSGGTESDHIPLLSMLTRPSAGTILISAIEHPAIREQAMALTHCGWKIVTIPVNTEGFITPDAVISHLTDDTILVCVMAVNNETGAIQPVYEIADALIAVSRGKRKPKLHIDCVQAAGKIPFDLSYHGIDSAAFSAHKICGPRGSGLLYLASDITPFLRGGGQEKNVRSGTENISGAFALSKCLERYFISPDNPKAVKRFDEQKTWTEKFIKNIAGIKNCTLIPHQRAQAVIAGRKETAEKFSPWIVQAGFAGIPGQVMVRALSSRGFYISTGSACSAKKQERPILEAMKVTEQERESAVRFSFGPHTTQTAMSELFTAVSDVSESFSGKAIK
jgi:cysteine desulfurase